MKALTVHPEWAFAKINMDKRIENRSWYPPINVINSRVALHAGKTIGGAGVKKLDALLNVVEMARIAGWELTRSAYGDDCFFTMKKGDRIVTLEEKAIVTGAIVAVMTITGAFEPVLLPTMPHWGIRGQKHWYLSSVDILPEPIPIAGKQRLWNMGEEQIREIERQMGKDIFNTVR